MGGSSGIGLAVAEQAASHGANVVIVSSSAERVQGAVQSIGGKAQGQTVDVSDVVESFFANLGAFDSPGFHCRRQPALERACYHGSQAGHTRV